MTTLSLYNDTPKHLLRWAGERVGLEGKWPSGAHPMAVVDIETSAIRAVLVVVETYKGILDVHFATDGSKKWATRYILRGLFGWMFLVRKAHRLQTVFPVDAKQTIRLALDIGFSMEGRLASIEGPGKDGYLFAMTKETCDWIKEEQVNG